MITLKDLMKRKATTDDARLQVSEILFHERTGHLRYVVLRTGGVLHHEDVLVAIGRFDPPPAKRDSWPVTLTHDDLAVAPAWETDDEMAVPMPLEAWPPIVVGPFGNTTSPLLFYAAMTAREEEPHEATHRPEVDPRVHRLERATRRLGAEVFGADGPLGRLVDMVVDPESFTITDFVVGDPPRRVPYGALRHMADEGDHTVLNLDRAGLDAAPPWQG